MIPTFPLFQLSRFSSLTSDLGLSPTSYLDTYNPQSGRWEQHTIGSVRVVETKQRLLYKIRKSLLEGLNDDECLSLREEVECQLQPSQVQAHPSSTIIPSSVSPPPLATTVPSNANIRGAYGGGNGNLKRQAHGTPDSAPAIKHRVTNGYYASSAMAPTSKSGEGASHVAQPGPSTPVSTVSTSSNQNTNYLYQTPAFYSTASTSVVPLPQYLMHPQSAAPAIPYHPHPPLKRWPNDYTVSELTAGFHAMELLISQSPNGSTMTQRMAFERVFGSRYVKSTVCRHRGVWRKAHRAIREEFEAMGEDERACWGEFVRRVEGRPPGRAGQGAGVLPVHEVIVYNEHVGGEGAMPPNATGVAGDVQGQPRPKGAEGEEEAPEEPVMDSLQNPADQGLDFFSCCDFFRQLTFLEGVSGSNKTNGRHQSSSYPTLLMSIGTILGNANVYDPALTNNSQT
jgi:hypothetical protein